MSENVRLSAKQEKAILELICPTNKALEDAAKKIGINERTLYRWLTLPHFKERLEEEKKKLREQAFDTLKATLNKAVEKLGGLLESDSEPIKLRASQTILGYNIKVAETEELEERLKALEEALERKK